MCLVFLVYSNTFQCPFVFDDTIILEKIASANLYSVIAELGWRPLSNLTLFANYKLGGRNVLGYHLFNVSIHCINAILLYLLIFKTLTLPKFDENFSKLEKRLIAFAGSAIWGVHPLNTESVTYIVQRGEALCMTFLLLSLLFLLAGENSLSRNWRNLFFFLSGFSCLLGFGAKEAMISAPFVIILYDWIFLSDGWRDFLRKRALFYLIALILPATLAFFFGLLSGYVSSAFFTDYGIRSFEYFINQSKVVCHYLSLAAYPSGQCFDYCWPVETSYARLLPYVAVLAFLAAAGFWLACRNIYIGFCAIALVILLAPRSSFAPRPDLAVEHRFYAPLAALACIIVCICYFTIKKISENRLLKRRRKIFFAAAGSFLILAAIIAYGTATFNRNSIYKTEMSLWQDTARKAPTNPRALNYLGIEYCRNGDLNRAAESFVRALEIHPDYDLAMNNLANILAMDRQFDKAIALYKKSILASSGKKSRTMLQSLQNMSRLYAEKKDWESLLRLSQFILEHSPGNSNASYMLGKAFLNIGEADQAAECFGKLVDSPATRELFSEKIADDISLCSDSGIASSILEHLLNSSPESPEFNYERGVVLLKESKLDKAKLHFEKTCMSSNLKRKAYSLNNLAIIAKREANIARAEELFKMAISVNDNYAAAHFNLGVLFLEKKEYKNALDQLRIAEKLAPGENNIKKIIKHLEGKKQD